MTHTGIVASGVNVGVIPPVGPMGPALLLYDIRNHVAGVNLSNFGSLGNTFDLPEVDAGDWSLRVDGVAAGTFGGPPSSKPWTFMFKVGDPLESDVVSAYGGFAFYPMSQIGNKALVGDADVTVEYVKMMSDTSPGLIDMWSFYGNTSDPALWPGSLFFCTVDFAQPSNPPGLGAWRDGVDETGSPFFEPTWGSAATPATIDAIFNETLQVRLAVTSNIRLEDGVTYEARHYVDGWGLFRGTPTPADLTTWASYWT